MLQVPPIVIDLRLLWAIVPLYLGWLLLDFGLHCYESRQSEKHHQQLLADIKTLLSEPRPELSDVPADESVDLHR